MEIPMDFSGAKKLSDTDLTAALLQALASERSNVAASIACLIEITARDLHTRLGASSLFVYLTRDLRLSESSASKRCAAVRAIRRFPEILDGIQSGRLHLSNISLISRHLTVENCARLIALAQKETQRGLEKVLAMEFTQPAKRDIVRPVLYSLQRVQASEDTRDKPEEKFAENCEAETKPDFFFESEVGSAQPALAVRVHVTLNPEATEALEFLGQAMPGKSISDILSLAICEFRNCRNPAKSASRKSSELGQATCSSESKANPVISNRYIPAALRREVRQRDGHRCSYVAPADSRPESARRCDAIQQLEFDHVTPRAFGGQNTLDNLRLLCRAHNNLAAKDLMGKEFIESHYGHG